MTKVLKKLSSIQREMKAPKNLKNKFGGYMYRNAEGILEAFKPFEGKYDVTLIICDEMVNIGERYYVKATATIYDNESGESIGNTAFARESEVKKGNDEAQITGATSSYARKYALNGLLLLDDTKDADSDEFKEVNDKKEEARKEEEKKETEKKEQASEFELDEFKQKCVENGIDYKEVWKATGNPSDTSKEHLEKAMKELEK